MASAALTNAAAIPAWPILPTLLLALTAAPAGSGAADGLKVVVTIKPVHSLVAGVMDGVAAPELLISGGGSPHAYALKPSHARALQKAHVVVRVSESLETYLNRPIANLATNAEILELDRAPGLTLHKPREGGLREDHVHGSGKHDDKKGKREATSDRHDDRQDGTHDPHLWLDPANAQALTRYIAAGLSRAFPVHNAVFEANAARLEARLGALDEELRAATAPVRGKPYIVFHDAYRYFEERYGLQPVGWVTVRPDHLPGAGRLAAIRERMNQEQADCLFAEPQFEPKLISTLIEGTRVRRGVLDPLGAGLAPGADMYFQMMRNLASGLNACLASPAQN